MDSEKIKQKKPLWVTVLIIIISLCALVIASVLVYNAFFRQAINKEKNTELALEYMDEKLQSNSKEAEIYRKENDEVIKKYNLDIFGSYTCTFNEVVEDSDKQENGMTYTTEVTRVMELKNDSTAVFDDGTKGWWMLKESGDGLVHLGLVVPEEKDPQIYLVCDNALIDENKAKFIGDVPEGELFDATFRDGYFTMEFLSNGKINAEYYEPPKENSNEATIPEAYGGNYKRSGNFLDIVLNGSPARYYIFTTEGITPEKPLKGFASRYYLKN